MILRLAWRNLRRNTRRSGFTAGGIAGAVALLVLFQSVLNGEIKSLVEGTLGTGVGHIQVHAQGFFENPSMDRLIQDTGKVVSGLADVSVDHAARLEFGGLVSGKASTDAAMMVGVNPEQEGRLNSMFSKVVQGRPLSSADSLAVVLGKELADSIGVRPGDTVVILSKSTRGSMAVDRFVVMGLFATGTQMDRNGVYLPLGAAQDLLETRGVSTIAVMIDDPSRADNLADLLQKRLGQEYQVLSYRRFQPTLYYITKIANAEAFIIAFVVYIIAALGVANTFLMAVMERTREYGLMLALGMKPRWLLISILAEAFMLFLLGAIPGLILGGGVVAWLSVTGIPVPGLEEMSRQFNLFFGNAIYPEFSTGKTLGLLVMVLLMTIGASVVPALKALKLEPAQTMRWV